MKKIKNWIAEYKLLTKIKSEDMYYYILLISAPLLISIYRYLTEAQNFLRYFPQLQFINNGEVFAYLLEYLAFAILFFFIPLLIAGKYKKTKHLLKLLDFKNMGRKTAWIFASIIFIIIPIAFIVSHNSDVRLEYPLPQTLNSNQQLLPIYFISLLFFYYLPWEFFFRGFLLFGLKDRYGPTEAILIQTISSCLVHINKPIGETLGAIPFGILFGIIALKTKNLWPLIILHAALGIFTDLFIIY